MKLRILIILSTLAFTGKAQLSAIDVVDMTVKIDGLDEKTLMYGFAEGDQIVFNFTEIDNKELKELEISEYPSNSKFMDYKTTKVENKTILVNKKAIYTFRFANSALIGRVCKIRIQRIPAKENLIKFNTDVELRTVNDTTWTNKTKVIIERVDTIPEVVLDKQGEIIHVAMNEHGAYSNVEVILPPQTAYWTYWIGVGEGSQQSFSAASEKLAAKSLKYLGLADPLAALAVGGVCYLVSETAVDNVAYSLHYYSVVDGVKQENMFHNGGDIIKPDYATMRPPKAPKEGYVFFKLYNDNTVDPISVFIKVMAIKYVPREKTVQYREPTVTSYQKPMMID